MQKGIQGVSVLFLQKFGDRSVAQIEHLRCKHRVRVLQGHEDITKQNVVSSRPCKGSSQSLAWYDPCWSANENASFFFSFFFLD